MFQICQNDKLGFSFITKVKFKLRNYRHLLTNCKPSVLHLSYKNLDESNKSPYLKV